MPVRLLARLAAALLGGLCGAVGSFAQATTVLGLPVGLVLALALTVATVLVGGVLARGTTGAVVALLSWVAAGFLLSLPGPGRDVVLPDRPASYVFLYGGAVLGAACLVLPYPRLADWVDGGGLEGLTGFRGR